jgi:lipocalin
VYLKGSSRSVTFQLDRYLGKWYEIARLDHSFERGLSDVSAQYRLQPDGSVEVINRGYSAEKGCLEGSHRQGTVFIGDPTLGFAEGILLRPLLRRLPYRRTR